MKSKLRTIISRAVYFVAITVQAATCVGDIKSDFIAAWEKRRTVAPCVRCRVEGVRVIPANSREHDGKSYPPEDRSFDEFSEYAYDLRQLRCRLESTYHVSARGDFLARRAISLDDSSGGNTFDIGGGPKTGPGSRPSIMVSRKSKIPSFLPDPVVWAVGFPSALHQIQDLRQFPFEFQTLTDGRTRAWFHVENGVYMILILNLQMEFAIESSWFSRDKNSSSEVGEMLINVVWQKLERGWFPMEWREESSLKIVSSRVTSWEFLDALPSDTFDEPAGARDPGNIVATPDGFREIDNDKSLIPIGARTKEGGFGLWQKIVIALAVVVVIGAMLRIRRQ